MTTADAAPALRPLAIGEVLDVAVKLVLRNLKDLAILAGLILLPLALLQTVVFASLAEDVDRGEPQFGSDSALVGGLVVSTLLNFLGALLVTLAVFRLLAAAYLGEDLTWRESLGFAARRMLSGLWLGFVMMIAILVGFVLLVLPGIWLSVALSVAFVALCVEDARGTKALRRSFRLVKGRWWATFATLVVATVLLSVISLIFGVVGGVASGVLLGESFVLALALNQLVSTLGSVLSYPFIAAVLVVIYLDLRVRKEAFDLRLLAERLGGGPGSPPASAAEGALSG